MNTECEVRILDIDVDEIISKLNDIGASKVGEFNFKRYIYNIIPKQEGRFIRLRTDGKKHI